MDNGKKRVFYLDFIRAIATITIILTHFNAVFIYSEPQMLDKVIITYKIFNLYIGDFGVSLFLIVSSAALTLTYEHKLEFQTYFKKRISTIYPMFYFTYAVFFLFEFYRNKGIDKSHSLWRFVFTVGGVDGLFSLVTPTFYLIGEWFLGFIIIFYMVFPMLRYFLYNFEMITILLTFFLFGIGLFLSKNVPMPGAAILLVRLPELVFGMVYIKHLKKVKMPLLFICITVILGNTLIRPNIDVNIQTAYVGIASFCVLSFISSFLENKISRWVSLICRYSYPIFLVHHYIIWRVAANFNLSNLTMLEVYLMFAVCLILIAMSSVVLKAVEKKMQSRNLRLNF